jgi:ATP-dependent RNA helicase RhlE
VRETLKPTLFLELIRRGDLKDVIVFTRTKHRANRLTEVLEKGGVSVARIHGNRSQAQRTLALDGFKNGKFQVLVATDIVARGIDVEELSHVVNFDVPNVPDDYIHRVGRTARADATGDAFTFVAPEEEGDLRAIERAVGRTLPRITVTGFNYDQAPSERFEVPIGERIAAIRARRAEDRKRAREKAERRTARDAGQSHTPRAASAPPARERSASPPTRERGSSPPARERSSSRPDVTPTSAGRDRVRGAWSPAHSPEAHSRPRSHDASRSGRPGAAAAGERARHSSAPTAQGSSQAPDGHRRRRRGRGPGRGSGGGRPPNG